MDKYRKITYFWIIALLILLLFHITTYFVYTSVVYPNPDDNKYIGDLGRTSYMVDILHERPINKQTFTKSYIDFKDYNGGKVDLVTIGDSFSQGMGFGLNRFYQDYIVNEYNLKVLNIQQLSGTDNYIETIVLLANSNYLKTIGVKYILIESVQREALERLTKRVNFFKISKNENFTSLINNQKEIYNINSLSENKITMINNLNFNALKYNLKYFFSGYGSFGSFYREKLNQKFFTAKSSSDIMFYADDINKLSLENVENIKLLNYNLNRLSDILEKQNIKLIFMPAVDKYNLYRKYIINQEYPKSLFFEDLRSLSKKYYFIDTKEILEKELKKGVIDLFYSDDTHWSYKASEIIIQDDLFRSIVQD
ncbi:hypothetical protein [uncultured Arcobacter sp.]|uniref:hypothetical protein n=1 Tax=uncultured Arcobacter sp. TaxID=165434 RepID=UPI00261337E2|nr:hypothetical protein [uncultured Arcobacter sp.]